MNLCEALGIRIPRRYNTRRNRRRAIIKWQNREDHNFYAEPRHWSANENEVRCAAHLADYVQRDATLKGYSAWSGCTVRELSKLLDNYRRHRLPGQRELAEKGGAK